MTDRPGGCLCGTIRYVVHGDPIAVAICHCTDCQRQSGSVFSVIAAVPVARYEQTGVAKTYIGKGDSGAAVYRNFCETCGTPISSKLATQPELIIVKVGTFDDHKDLKPQVEVYTHRAPDWLPPLAPVRYPGPPNSSS